MAKVSIGTLEKTFPVSALAGFAGGETRAYFQSDKDPLHVHLHKIAEHEAFRIGPMAADCILYVWQGGVHTRGRSLSAGSSLIVENGAYIDLEGGDEDSLVLSFAPAKPANRTSRGGRIHLLPTEHVPRVAELGGSAGVGGGMHANASSPTCALWLHENHFQPQEKPPADPGRGIHSHSEDEVIFVTRGNIRLGTKLYGPGTALAIAADTFYSFSPGPEGLSFINFRAGLPNEIVFPNGNKMDEVAYWKERVATPHYL